MFNCHFVSLSTVIPIHTYFFHQLLEVIHWYIKHLKGRLVLEEQSNVAGRNYVLTYLIRLVPLVWSIYTRLLFYETPMFGMSTKGVIHVLPRKPSSSCERYYFCSVCSCLWYILNEYESKGNVTKPLDQLQDNSYLTCQINMYV